MTALLTRHHRWAGLGQGFRVTRRRVAGGVATEEAAYGITSLAPDRADAGRLRELVRGHRRIENGPHDVRDVTLGEDAGRVRSGNAPQVPAAMRNAAIHLLAGVEATSRAAATRRLAARPEEALELLHSTSRQ